MSRVPNHSFPGSPLPLRVLLAAMVFALLPLTVRGQELAYEPFDRAWDLDGAQRVRGAVSSILENTFALDLLSKSLSSTPSQVKLVYKDGRPVQRFQVLADGSERLDVEIAYRDGWPMSVTAFVKVSGETEVKTVAQVASRNAAGELESVELRPLAAEQARVFPIKTEPSDNGGRVVSWERNPGGPGTSTTGPTTRAGRMVMSFRLQYDRDGRLVRRQLLRDEQVIQDVAFTYNDRGDIESYRLAPTARAVYEREYDAAGNWTRQTRFLEREINGKTHREVQEAKTREISYAH
jgi:hypothetical protein